jgi:hypothetical protein
MSSPATAAPSRPTSTSPPRSIALTTGLLGGPKRRERRKRQVSFAPKNRHGRPNLSGPLSATRLSCFKMKDAGRGQLKSLRNFLRISLRSLAYSSMIRRASSVREGLLGGSGFEVGSSSRGIIERSFEVCFSIGSPPATRNAALRG